MNDAKLLSAIETFELVATFLVVVGVAGELAGSWLARPVRKRLEAAQVTELARLQRETSAANERAAHVESDGLVLRGNVAALEKLAADAKAAQNNVEIDLERQRARAAEAERLLAEVNERTKDRHLLPERRGAFVASLLKWKGQKLSIFCLDTGPEAKALGVELASAFKDAGWEIDLQIRHPIVGPSARGLILSEKGLGSIGISAALFGAFSAAGLPLTVSLDLPVGVEAQEGLALVVGSK